VSDFLLKAENARFGLSLSEHLRALASFFVTRGPLLPNDLAPRGAGWAMHQTECSGLKLFLFNPADAFLCWTGAPASAAE
jgi:hypothetical protein